MKHDTALKYFGASLLVVTCIASIPFLPNVFSLESRIKSLSARVDAVEKLMKAAR